VEEHQDRFDGTVKWFSDRKGYGFIVREGGEDVFVHYSGIRAGGPRSLYEGDKVQFAIQEDPRGPRAIDLVVTQEAQRPAYGRWLLNTNDTGHGVEPETEPHRPVVGEAPLTLESESPRRQHALGAALGGTTRAKRGDAHRRPERPDPAASP
jgi:CspA family cold shock protein